MNEKVKNIVQTVIFSILMFGLAFICWFTPDKDFSETERRELAKFPSLSLSTLSSGRFMSTFEEYTLDQFPARDFFRAIKAYTSKYIFGHKSNNDIYVSDGAAVKIEYPMNQNSISNASKKFTFIYDTYLKNNNCNVYISVIPDKNAFYADKNSQLKMDYEAFYSQLKSENEYATFIDIDNLLTADDYYRTDTHWKQESIIDVAEKLADKMGTELHCEYVENETDKPFNGVYSGQSALPLEADSIKYLTAKHFDECKIFDHESNREIEMYDFKKLDGRDPYEMYLSGSLSLITIDNPAAKTDKHLVLFRDSFGGSIAPLLSDGYSRITLVDIRYISSQILDKFIDFSNSDVLFLYSTSVLNNSNTLK